MYDIQEARRAIVCTKITSDIKRISKRDLTTWYRRKTDSTQLPRFHEVGAWSRFVEEFCSDLVTSDFTKEHERNIIMSRFVYIRSSRCQCHKRQSSLFCCCVMRFSFVPIFPFMPCRQHCRCVYHYMQCRRCHYHPMLLLIHVIYPSIPSFHALSFPCLAILSKNITPLNINLEKKNNSCSDILTVLSYNQSQTSDRAQHRGGGGNARPVFAVPA